MAWPGNLLLHRESEFFVYANGLVHKEFCLTRDCLTFFHRDVQLSITVSDRVNADLVKVLFVASRPDQKRQGRAITRVRLAHGTAECRVQAGAFEALVELLDV